MDMEPERKTDNFAVLASRTANATTPFKGDGGPMRKRFDKTVELAEHVKALTNDLAEALIGGAPPSKGIPIKHGPAEKGMLAEFDQRAVEIENHLENIKAIVEHLRRAI